jgi:DNA repair exonuclease SbcCD ATPase subunit
MYEQSGNLLERDLENLRQRIQEVRDEVRRLDEAQQAGAMIDGQPVDTFELQRLRDELTALRRQHDELANAVEGELVAPGGPMTAISDFFIDNKFLVSGVVIIAGVVGLLVWGLKAQETSPEDAAKIRKGMGMVSHTEQVEMMKNVGRMQAQQEKFRLQQQYGVQRATDRQSGRRGGGDGVSEREAQRMLMEASGQQ